MFLSFTTLGRPSALEAFGKSVRQDAIGIATGVQQSLAYVKLGPMATWGIVCLALFANWPAVSDREIEATEGGKS